MTYTSHGHFIVGSKDDNSEPPPVKGCGGPEKCAQCYHDVDAEQTFWRDKPILDVSEGKTDVITVDLDKGADTMDKARNAIVLCGYTVEEAVDIIREMQNAGILFRERT